MGLTKQYLRYVPTDKFNLISSSDCNAVFVTLKEQEGRFVAVGACEDIYIWDLRLGEKALTLLGGKHKVTYLAASTDLIHLAAGFSNGAVNIYDLTNGENSTVFTGHKSPISCLAFDSEGHRLASGSMDTDVVVWDIIAESGLERLSGHKGVVTGVCFMKSRNVVVTSSKDTFIKLWDLETVHCFQTIAANVTEIWNLCIVGDDRYIAAGSGDSEIRVWSLSVGPSVDKTSDDDMAVYDVLCQKVGCILRSGKGRTISMVTDNTCNVLCVHGTDNLVEIFYFLSEDAAKTHWKKRLAKERKKAAKLGIEMEPSEMSLKDIIKRLASVKTPGRVKSVAAVQGTGELRVTVSLSNNQLELYSIPLESSKTAEATLLRQINQWGHQGEVRAVAFSSDNLAIASVGTSAIKMWNRASLNCLRTVDCEHGVSVIFVPGDRFALVGNKAGHLLIYDVVAGELIEDIPAHKTELWSICLLHDKSGVLTGGGDKTVKEWKFDLVRDDGSKNLSLIHSRTLKLDDAVLAVKASPCGTYLAASLLDSTVRIHYLDTFKFFLSLYGHAMPVLCLDISYDSKIIITGSSDKKIKIWGLDFGDCHKSLFAHDEAVTAISFVPNTHYFFSIGRDGKIKEWDGDKFEKIITFDGHFGEGWCLSVGGNHVVTCGQDRCMRLYSKTEEILTLEDEQEEERAREEEEQLASDAKPGYTLPSTRTVSAEVGADLLMECLEAIKSYKEESKTSSSPTVPPMMAALEANTTSEYLTKILQKIRPSEMGEVLLILPLHLVKEMLNALDDLLSNPLMCEMAIKSMLLLIKVHSRVLEGDTSLLQVFERLEAKAFSTLRNLRDTVGVNLYGLRYIHQDMEEKQGIKLFADASLKRKEKAKRKARKEKAQQAVIMSM